MASKLPLLLVVPFAISCGGDDTPHTIKTPDSNMGSGSGSGSGGGGCALNASYTPAFGSDTNFALDYPSTGSGSAATAHEIGYIGVLDNADIADVLYIDLYAGYGGFKGSGSGSGVVREIRPGTYVLAGDELNYHDCGICVYAAGDFDLMSKDVAAWYFATGGTVTLSTVTLASGSNAGRIAGSWTGLQLHQVNTNADGTFLDPDATPNGTCASQIGDTTFDVPVEPDTGSATGKGHIRIPVQVHRDTALHHRFY